MLQPSRLKRLIARRETKFLLVGGINTVVGFSLFVVIDFFFGERLGAVTVLLLASVPSTLFAYTLQRLFVWQSDNKILAEITRFLISTGFQVAANAILLFLLADVVMIPRVIAQAITTVLLIISIFFIHKYWTFKSQHQDADTLETTLR